MRVLDVLELTAYLKELVEFDPILSDVWVRGEVSNLSTSAAGHSYFTLAGDGVQLNCVLFRGRRSGLIAIPRNGDSVLSHGRISIYESRGQYQLVVDTIAPEGIGILQLQFEETRRRLEAEGLFAPERKRPIPEMPRVIGVVTSEQGAVWHDIQTVIARRFPLVRLVLAPSTVQGPSAPGQLITALTSLDDSGLPDVIIIGRGGGSMEDLACFNDEGLARAIFGCRTPVVSAVGHETDVCIADLVADVRAPTPSAAAELCVPDRRTLLANVGGCTRDARSLVGQAVEHRRTALNAVRSSLTYRSPTSRIGRARQDVDAVQSRALSLASRHARNHRREVSILQERATLLDPSDVMRRGYAVVTSLNGAKPQRLSSAEDASKHSAVTITFRDGSVSAGIVKESLVERA